MSPDYRREIRGVLLLSLFIMVVPLVFFPKDFGLRMDMPFSLLSAFELGWYVVILSRFLDPPLPVFRGNRIWSFSGGHVLSGFVFLFEVGNPSISAFLLITGDDVALYS